MTGGPIRKGLALFWLALSLLWLSQDRLLRDGDEEGHVGAAELFRQWLAEGRWGFALDQAIRGDLGEYPPLYPAVIGAWWWLTGLGQPAELAVRGINLLWPLITAWAVAGLARRLHSARGWKPGEPLDRDDAAATAAFALALALPLLNGLARHFMPEGMLVAMVALSVGTAAWAAERPGPFRALVLGLVCGLGMLVKQTFVLYAFAPVLVAGWGLGAWLVGAAAAGALLAIPWYLGHLQQQLAYGTASVAGAEASALEALTYYPWALWWIVLGPVLLMLGGLGATRLALVDRQRSRDALLVGLVWVVFGLAVLVLIPKKYPRLAAPLSPAAPLLIGAALAWMPHRLWILAATTALAWGWLAWTSVQPYEPPYRPAGVDPRCPQVWLRPPFTDDLGLSAVADAVRAAPEGPVVVKGAPEIPCALQTTHPWLDHLGPYLRREGLEREIRSSGRGAVLVDWTAAPTGTGGTWVAVPALGGGFRLQAR